jgi:hypothetical protein
MSDLIRLALPVDYADRIAAMVRRLSVPARVALDDLIARDLLVTDDGAPQPEFVAWVARLLAGGFDGDAAGLVPAPAPVAPHGHSGAALVRGVA